MVARLGERDVFMELDLGQGPSGGIVECGTERALWLPYVSVPDIARMTEQARVLGAEVPLSRARARRAGGACLPSGRRRDRPLAVEGLAAGRRGSLRRVLVKR